MDDQATIDRGDIVDAAEVEPMFELSGDAIAYLATHQLASAPADLEGAF